MLSEGDAYNEEEYIGTFRRYFKPQPGFDAEYALAIEGKKKKLILSVRGPKLECYYGNTVRPDVEMQLTRGILEDIVNGRMTFQRAFMSGGMKTKGDFKVLRTLDQLFVFEEKGI